VITESDREGTRIRRLRDRLSRLPQPATTAPQLNPLVRQLLFSPQLVDTVAIDPASSGSRHVYAQTVVSVSRQPKTSKSTVIPFTEKVPARGYSSPPPFTARVRTAVQQVTQDPPKLALIQRAATSLLNAPARLIVSVDSYL
jgi:hypothetical protein